MVNLNQYNLVCVFLHYPLISQLYRNKCNKNKNISLMWTLSKCIIISYSLMVNWCTILVMVIEVNFSLKNRTTFATTNLWPKSEWALSCEFVILARKKIIMTSITFKWWCLDWPHIAPEIIIRHWSNRFNSNIFIDNWFLYYLKTNLHLVKASVSLLCSICLWWATRHTG